MIAPLLAMAALAAVDPCAPVDPAVAADPETAAVYRSVGDAEAKSGSTDVAAVAYRSAASLDPADEASRTALRRLCAGRRPDLFREGLAQMKAGDHRAAIASFRAVRQSEDDPALMVLEGICNYELGDDAAAEALLREAERSPPDADVARLYLGLLALRAGATVRAAALFDAAGASAALSPAASDLARVARTYAPWTLTFFTETGYDTNVPLVPSGAPPSSQGDGLWSIGAAAVVRPSGPTGPFLRGQGIMTEQLSLDAYDAASADAAAGWALRGDRWSGVAEYQFTYRTFGGERLLSSHQGLASAWLVIGGATLGGTVLGRVESYAPDWSSYSGTLTAAEARGSIPLGARARLVLAYAAARDATESAALSWVEHGPRVDLLAAPWRAVRLGVACAGTSRRYDGVDPTFGLRREETYVDAEVRAEWEPARRWTLRVGARARRALSNVPALEYDKLVPMAGLAYTWSP